MKASVSPLDVFQISRNSLCLFLFCFLISVYTHCDWGLNAMGLWLLPVTWSKHVHPMPSYVMLPLIGTSRIIFVSFSLSIDSTFLWKSSLTTLPTPDWIRHRNESLLSIPTIPQEQGQCRSFSLSHTYCCRLYSLIILLPLWERFLNSFHCMPF